MERKCSRCGGTGLVSRGMVINGVCYGCGGNGKARPRGHASSRSVRVRQWALLDANGRHLAINTDRDVLAQLQIPGSAGIIVEI